MASRIRTWVRPVQKKCYHQTENERKEDQSNYHVFFFHRPSKIFSTVGFYLLSPSKPQVSMMTSCSWTTKNSRVGSGHGCSPSITCCAGATANFCGGISPMKSKMLAGGACIYCFLGRAKIARISTTIRCRLKRKASATKNVLL